MHTSPNASQRLGKAPGGMGFLLHRLLAPFQAQLPQVSYWNHVFFGAFRKLDSNDAQQLTISGYSNVGGTRWSPGKKVPSSGKKVSSSGKIKFEGQLVPQVWMARDSESQACAFEIRAVSFRNYRGTLLCAREAMYIIRMMECVQQACHSLDVKLHTA